MTTLRRLKLILACFLAMTFAAGAVLPAPALWQCRHAARVVSGVFSPLHSAMPCRMSGKPMPHMACCLGETASSLLVSPAASSHRPALSSPACHSVLVSLAAPLLANAPEAQTHLRRHLAALLAVLPLPAALAPLVPAVFSLRQRPPPTLGASLSAPQHSFGLRAPPAA